MSDSEFEKRIKRIKKLSSKLSNITDEEAEKLEPVKGELEQNESEECVKISLFLLSEEEESGTANEYEPTKEESKKSEPVKEESKKSEPVNEESKKSEPVKEESKKSEPIKDKSKEDAANKIDQSFTIVVLVAVIAGLLLLLISNQTDNKENWKDEFYVSETPNTDSQLKEQQEREAQIEREERAREEQLLRRKSNIELDKIQQQSKRESSREIQQRIAGEQQKIAEEPIYKIKYYNTGENPYSSEPLISDGVYHFEDKYSIELKAPSYHDLLFNLFDYYGNHHRTVYVKRSQTYTIKWLKPGEYYYTYMTGLDWSDEIEINSIISGAFTNNINIYINDKYPLELSDVDLQGSSNYSYLCIYCDGTRINPLATPELKKNFPFISKTNSPDF